MKVTDKFNDGNQEWVDDWKEQVYIVDISSAREYRNTTRILDGKERPQQIYRQPPLGTATADRLGTRTTQESSS